MVSDILKSVGAGIAIALGGYVFISLQGGLPGAVMFSLGLLCVCLNGLNLYTGKICYFADNRKELSVFWYLSVLVLNLAAAALVGIAASFCASPDASAFVRSIAEAKLAKLPLNVFLSGVFCDFFIYLAVHAWKKHADILGALIIVLAVAGFIVTGSEHCVADCFYFAAAGMSPLRAAPFMLLAIAGNTAGGIFARAVIR